MLYEAVCLVIVSVGIACLVTLPKWLHSPILCNFRFIAPIRPAMILQSAFLFMIFTSTFYMSSLSLHQAVCSDSSDKQHKQLRRLMYSCKQHENIFLLMSADVFPVCWLVKWS